MAQTDLRELVRNSIRGFNCSYNETVLEVRNSQRELVATVSERGAEVLSAEVKSEIVRIAQTYNKLNSGSGLVALLGYPYSSRQAIVQAIESQLPTDLRVKSTLDFEGFEDNYLVVNEAGGVFISISQSLRTVLVTTIGNVHPSWLAGLCATLRQKFGAEATIL